MANVNKKYAKNAFFSVTCECINREKDLTLCQLKYEQMTDLMQD